MKRVIKKRGKGKKMEYQVEWEGEEWAGQYTWEPAANMASIISSFRSGRRQRRSHEW